MAKSALEMTSTGTAEVVTDRGSARLPTTTTACTSPPTSISTSRVTVASALIATASRVNTLKPGRLNTTS